MPRNQFTPIPDLTDAEIARFWSKIDKRGPDECWPWIATGSADKDGYGRMGITRDGKIYQVRANRLGYLIQKGEDPAPLQVLHKCDNAPCCNAAHLFLGTNRDNIDDCLTKGRWIQGKRHHWWKNGDSVGEQNPKAKATAEMVKFLLQEYEKAKREVSGLGRRGRATGYGAKRRAYSRMVERFGPIIHESQADRIMKQSAGGWIHISRDEE